MTKITKAIYAALALFGVFLLINAVSLGNRVDDIEHGKVRGKIGATVLHSSTNIIGGHANAIAGVQAGFMSAADKARLDGFRFDQLAQATSNTTFGDGILRLLAIGTPNSGTTDGANALYVDRKLPGSRFRLGSDFIQVTGTLSTTVFTPSEGGFIKTVTGAGSDVTVLATGNDDKRIGIVELVSGTTTTGFGFIGTTATGTNEGTFRIATSGRFIMDALVTLPVASDGTNTYEFTAGWSNDATHGMFMACDNNANAHWRAKIGNGSFAYTDLGINCTTAATHLVMDKTAGADSVTFYVDGVSGGTVSSGLPTGLNLQLTAKLQNSAGTGSGRVADIDWLYTDGIYARVSGAP